MSSRTLIRTAATNILRNHFDTEASDAGLRSLDLASTGAKGSSSYDSSAVARADRGHGNDHRRVRASLKRLHAKHVEVLSLAYGTRLRTRDVEDSKKRKALPQHERNWRVRLAELYGADGLIALASPLARKLFTEHMGALREVMLEQELDDVDASALAGGMIAWLLDTSREDIARIDADARRCLNEALDAFAEAHGITPPEPAPRHRSSERTRTRILANHHEHGQEIGR
jgi:hypothetical protein